MDQRKITQPESANSKHFTLTNDLKERLNKLKLTYEPYDPNKPSQQLLKSASVALQYQSLGWVLHYPDQRLGLLVQMSPHDQEYNDGIYSLLADTQAKLPAYLLHVIVPNRKSKGARLTMVSQQISNYVNGLDLHDLAIFDFNEVIGQVVIDSVIMPMAKALFPDESEQNQLLRERFRNLYLARFLANTAATMLGSSKINEEVVNSEPYWIRQQLVQSLDPSAKASLQTVSEQIRQQADDIVQAMGQIRTEPEPGKVKDDAKDDKGANE